MDINIVSFSLLKLSFVYFFFQNLSLPDTRLYTHGSGDLFWLVNLLSVHISFKINYK